VFNLLIELNLIALLQTTVALLLFTQGVLVLIQNHKSALNRSFFVFQLAVTIWLIGMGLGYIAQDEELAFLFVRIGFLGVIFIPVSTYAFSVYFAGQQKQAPLVILGVLSALFLAPFIAFAHPLMTLGVLKYPWGNYIHLGNLGYAAAGLFALFTPLFIRNFYIKYIESPPEQKRWSLLALITGSLAFLAAADFLPAYGIALPAPPLGFVFVGVFATLMAYFILRHRLSDIKILLGRTIGYLTLTGTLLVIYTILFLIASPLDYSARELILNALLFGAALSVFSFLHQKSQRIVDAIFLREKQNFERAIVHFIVQLRNLRTPDELLKSLFTFIEDDLRIDATYAAFLMPYEMTWEIYGPRNIYSPRARPIKTTNLRELEKFFINSAEAVWLEDLQSQSFPEFIGRELLTFTNKKDVLAIPLVHRASLMGFLILGKKSSMENYLKEEGQALNDLGAPFSVAWQNAKLYENIQNVNQLKSDFVSIMSHRLRTPLSRLKWSLDSIREGGLELFSKEQQKFLRQIEQDIESMILLVKQLLNIAQLERGKPPTASFDLLPLIQEVINAHLPSLEEKQISFAFNVEGKMARVIGEPDYTKSVLATLLENAIQYTKSKGVITLTALRANSREIMITIKDTGIGIPKNQQENVFTRFFRANNAAAMHPNGAGLGLFYAKALIEKQHGRIWFRSEEGQGTEFFVAIRTAS